MTPVPVSSYLHVSWVNHVGFKLFSATERLQSPDRVATLPSESRKRAAATEVSSWGQNAPLDIEV